VIREQDAFRLPECAADEAALVVGDRHAGPLLEVRASVQHRAIHMDSAQRLPGCREGRGVRRMRMDDRLYVRPRAVDPDVEANARIRPAAGERLQVLVYEHHALGARFLEAVAELRGPPRVGRFGARGDLAGEAGLVAFTREDPARARERAARFTRSMKPCFISCSSVAASRLWEMR
jgi:hypothetical protein